MTDDQGPDADVIVLDPNRVKGVAKTMQETSASGAWDALTEDDDVLPNGATRCTAKSRNEREDGTRIRCKRGVVAGANVCPMHGGKAPQVQRAARLRLLEMIDPAVTRLGKIVKEGKDGDALRAIENVLDRAGIPRRTDVDVTVAQETLRDRIVILRERIQSGEITADDLLTPQHPAGLGFNDDEDED